MVTDSVRMGWSGLRERIGDLKSDKVIAVLEEQILSGDLAPGTQLPPESELCQALGVSRTVLRDAVRMLVARGLLNVKQGRGTVVAEPNEKAYADSMVALLARSNLQVRDVMEARISIETMVAGIAAQAGTEADWDALDRLEKSLVHAISIGDEDSAREAHAAFHAGILNATHQPALILILNSINNVALLTGSASVRAGKMSDWDLNAHRLLLDALKIGDPQAAVKAMKNHFMKLNCLPIYDDLLDRPFSEAYLALVPRAQKTPDK
ncbi:MAG: FadR/GntR family transcriptional regulator [Canibacter sp.]